MDEFDYCRIADSFNLPDAAALIVGVPPSWVRENLEGFIYICEPKNYKDQDINEKFQVVLKALKNTVEKGNLPYIKNSQKPDETLIDVEDLRKWLARKGFRSGFFFHDKSVDAPEYLNKNNPKYSAKLAASVLAWEHATTQPLNGKTPKQTMEKWLREHASDYGMTDDDGKPIEAAIEQCCKVANWNLKGGAPKTEREPVEEIEEPDIPF